MEYHYKVYTPQLNGKVERSYHTDHKEFYHLIPYKEDVDLTGKRSQRENFLTFELPHGAHADKTPYEVLKTLLKT